MWYGIIGFVIAGIYFSAQISMGIWYLIELGHAFTKDSRYKRSEMYDKVSQIVFFKSGRFETPGYYNILHFLIGLATLLVWPITLIAGTSIGVMLYVRQKNRNEEALKNAKDE